MSRNSNGRSYRNSYFRNENQAENSGNDEEYIDDLENYECFEMLTKKYINKEYNIFNEKSEELLESQNHPSKPGKIEFVFADWIEESKDSGEEFIYEENWKKIAFKIKGKFKCDHCDRIRKNKNGDQTKQSREKNAGWTTGNGTLQFLIKEDFQEKIEKKQFIQMKVMARAFSQQCKKCKRVGDFNTYYEEIDRTALYLCYKIAKQYRFNIKEKNPGKQRPSKMNDSHQVELCLACKAGECVWRNNNHY